VKDIFNKFPPKRKDEFLRWVMIATPKYGWWDVVLDYIKYHEIKNWYEGLQLILTCSTDPPRVAYWMVGDGYAEPEWAMKVIENDKVGNPSHFAYEMVRDGLTKDTEWAMRVIENDKTGNPSWAADRMVKHGHAPQEWYDRNFG